MAKQIFGFITDSGIQCVPQGGDESFALSFPRRKHPILKPCPFCGSPAEVLRAGTQRQSCIIACTDCGARMESGETGDMQGRRWNMRK